MRRIPQILVGYGDGENTENTYPLNNFKHEIFSTDIDNFEKLGCSIIILYNENKRNPLH